MAFESIDPSTGRRIATYPALDAAAREQLLASLHARQREWRKATIAQRGKFILALAEAMREQREQLAGLLTQEMGKPITAARAEVDKCITLCEGAPAAAEKALAHETALDNTEALVRVEYHPLGTVLAVMPWNFPYWQALRFAVPALLAGNGVIVKPAGSVAGGALLMQQCIQAASRNISDSKVPAAPLEFALIEVNDIDSIIADHRIVGVTLTGSDRAGRAVARTAGAHLKKAVLELGGSDPFIVLPSADIDKAANVAASARTVNSGQSCIAAKRFIVCEAVYDEFLSKFSDAMRELTVGDPREESTQIGPIATESVRNELSRQVRESVQQGARIVVGGEPVEGSGFYYPPTVLVEVPDSAPAAREELFGPVASVFRVRDTAEAITRANETSFGLGASVWSNDQDEIERAIAELDAGMVFVNDMVVSDPRYPFGGVKQSGLGRELGEAGYREFTNVKTVRIARTPRAEATSLAADRIVGE